MVEKIDNFFKFLSSDDPATSICEILKANFGAETGLFLFVQNVSFLLSSIIDLFVNWLRDNAAGVFFESIISKIHFHSDKLTVNLIFNQLWSNLLYVVSTGFFL